MSAPEAQPPAGDGPELIYTGEEYIVIRDFVIRGLAASVPEFLSRDKAADLITEWMPGDQLALASLYRRIAESRPLRTA